MKKIGCSNISILTTLIGILPLLLGIFVFYKELSSGTEITELVILFPVILFGLIACGYRSCLFINDKYVEIRKSILGKIIKKKQFKHNEYKKINIDIESHHAMSSGEVSGGKFYSIIMVGSNTAIKPLEFTEFTKVREPIGTKECWTKINVIANKISELSELPIEYSEKVKDLNKTNNLTRHSS